MGLITVLQLAKIVLILVNRHRNVAVNGNTSLPPNSSEGNLNTKKDRGKEKYRHGEMERAGRLQLNQLRKVIIFDGSGHPRL